MWAHEYLVLHPAVPHVMAEMTFPRSRRWLVGVKLPYSEWLVEAARRDLELLSLAQVKPGFYSVSVSL